MSQQLEDVKREIQLSADYGNHPAGVLADDELVSMHAQVMNQMQTTNGDAGDCVISARQLALLLNSHVTK